MPARYLRGAFISFIPNFLAFTPNVIVFQYNPEEMTHSWSEQTTKSKDETQALAVKGNPTESFSFTLKLDAQDIIAAKKAGAPLAQATGLHTELAALETLQFPVDQGQAGKLPRFQLPLVLFVWGAGRIVPVRIKRLSVTEKLFSDVLNPLQAEVDIELDRLDDAEIKVLPKNARKIAETVTAYSTRLRQTLATANLANAVEGTIGMLPV